MARKKKEWWKSGKLKPREIYGTKQSKLDRTYTYNPISEYTETKKPKDFKPKYELEYPYEWRDSDHNADFHETETAQFETLDQAKEAKRAGESEEYFTPDYAPYVIKKIKSKVKPKKKSKSMIKKPKSISKSIVKKSKSLAKKPKSVVYIYGHGRAGIFDQKGKLLTWQQQQKLGIVRINGRPVSMIKKSKSIAKRPKSMIKKATRKMRRK